jgi:hypothetical protein
MEGLLYLNKLFEHYKSEYEISNKNMQKFPIDFDSLLKRVETLNFDKKEYIPKLMTDFFSDPFGHDFTETIKTLILTTEDKQKVYSLIDMINKIYVQNYVLTPFEWRHLLTMIEDIKENKYRLASEHTAGHVDFVLNTQKVTDYRLKMLDFTHNLNIWLKKMDIPTTHNFRALNSFTNDADYYSNKFQLNLHNIYFIIKVLGLTTLTFSAFINGILINHLIQHHGNTIHIQHKKRFIKNNLITNKNSI